MTDTQEQAVLHALRTLPVAVIITPRAEVHLRMPFFPPSA